MSTSTTAPSKRSKGLASSTTLLLKSCANDPRRRNSRASGLWFLRARAGPLKHEQFTFAVDQPACTSPKAGPVAVEKSNLKPSSQFHDTVIRRIRPSMRSTATYNVKDDSHTNNASAGPSDERNNVP